MRFELLVERFSRLFSSRARGKANVALYYIRTVDEKNQSRNKDELPSSFILLEKKKKSKLKVFF